MRKIQSDGMRDSEDPEDNRLHTGYLASSRWLERAADALERMADYPPIPPAALHWVVGGDTGMSSLTIWAVMTGAQPEPNTRIGAPPADAGDFGRCVRLLQRVPEWRERLPEVVARFPGWRTLIAAWDEITALYHSEEGQLRTQTHQRIRQALDEARGTP